MKSAAILFLFLLSSLAFGKGGCGGHGGDGYSLEFYRIGKHFAMEFISWKESDFIDLGIKFSPKQFEHVVENTRIYSSSEDLALNGKIVDAINYSNLAIPEIHVNRKRWDSYQDNRRRKLGLVLHEYLGILKGLYNIGEWDNYPVSSKLLDLYDTKTTIEHAIFFSKRQEKIKESFQSAQNLRREDLDQNLSWSCVEYSALTGDTTKYIHQNAYLFNGIKNHGNWAPESENTFSANGFTREWTDEDPTEEIDRPQSTIREYLRLTANGDLISEVTTDYKYDNQPSSIVDPSRGVLSYLFCSRIVGETLSKLRFMHTSLSHIFKTPETQEYKKYANDISKLKNTGSYKKCTEGNNNQCTKLYKMLSEIKLAPEKQSVQVAKKNIDAINLWIEGLPKKDKEYVSRPITKLFNNYLYHQRYLMDLMDLNDAPNPAGGFGIINFIDSLEVRLPEAYRESKLNFSIQLNEIQNEFIKNSF